MKRYVLLCAVSGLGGHRLFHRRRLRARWVIGRSRDGIPDRGQRWMGLSTGSIAGAGLAGW